MIAVELIAATGKAGRARRAPAYLALALAGSGIDLLATGAAIGKELLRRPHRWADEAQMGGGEISPTGSDPGDRSAPPTAASPSLPGR